MQRVELLLLQLRQRAQLIDLGLLRGKLAADGDGVDLEALRFESVSILQLVGSIALQAARDVG